MSDLEQLERTVQNLSPEDFAKFRDWFLELDERLWDQQIAEDLETGKLDGLIDEALEDFRAGRARELRSTTPPAGSGLSIRLCQRKSGRSRTRTTSF